MKDYGSLLLVMAVLQLVSAIALGLVLYALNDLRDRIGRLEDMHFRQDPFAATRISTSR